MPKIFISYRRADSQYVIDGIHTELCKHFPEEDVFLDVESIPLGVDFDIYLRDQIAAYDVVLAIIGPDWERIMKDRAGQEDDFVRIEIENALQQNKIVIPVLVKEAEMPDFSDLPASIQGLQRKNNIRIRRKPDLSGDVKRLVDGITTALTYTAKRETLVRMKQQASTQTVSKAMLRPDKTILPDPFEWTYIPAGDVILKEGGYVPMGGEKFSVVDFYISKYPITNAQYAIYVDESGNVPDFWTDHNFNGSLQPVVGVSWHDAIGYCHWLSENIGYVITLPTEHQWQRAAQGDEKFIYPWGNVWDSNNSNANRRVGKTSSVLQYPEGASPYNVYDMSGNIWEWCLTDWNTGTHDRSGEEKIRVMRGGSWMSSTIHTQSEHRDSELDFVKSNTDGFRVCTAIPEL